MQNRKGNPPSRPEPDANSSCDRHDEPTRGDACEAHEGNGQADLDFDPAKLSAPAPETGPDPFDVDALRLSGDMNVAAGVKKLQTTIPVRKPDKTKFVRVHPDDSYSLLTGVIELKDDRELYLVAPTLRSHLEGETAYGMMAVYTAITRQGDVFLWPVRPPTSDGNSNVRRWSDSALEAVQRARKQWLRVVANMSAGGYDLFVSTADLPEPVWPDLTFQEIVRTAFKGLLINSLDHPILQRLRGEV